MGFNSAFKGLKSSVSVCSKIRRRDAKCTCVFFPISDNVYENFDLTAVVATVYARTEEPSANGYSEGMGQAEDGA